MGLVTFFYKQRPGELSNLLHSAKCDFFNFSIITLRFVRITVFLLFFFNTNTYSQLNTIKDGLLKLTVAIDSFNHVKPEEKAYLRFDKTYYAMGDTIWYKAYLFNAAYLTPSGTSGILYVDIANDSNKVIKQYRLPVQTGITWGNISLDEKDFTPGTYTIRAYTNWMRNFGDDYFFYERFYITGANESSWLVNSQVKTSIGNDKLDVAAKLQFTDINKITVADKPMQLLVLAGTKTLLRQKTQTDHTGLLNINFNLADESGAVSIVAESEQKDRRLIIPMILNRAENTDLQFLPEGGDLVADLPAHIGFKAIGENGRGISVSGIIVNHEQKQVVSFQSLHNGIGCFDLVVQSGESYTAKVTLPNGITGVYALPAVKNSGTVMQVKSSIESDSLEVAIATSNDLVQSARYFLVGKARGVICYAAVINFHNSKSVKRKIAKQLFPTGITHFTLLTTQYQPLNERLIFIDHHENLEIQLTPENPAYQTRDSIAIHIKVTDNKGQPVQGNFTLAITDDAQVKKDILNDQNIINNLLLTSDLKGYTEDPGYYFSSKTSIVWQALDNLLLTQGWVRYNWQQVFDLPLLQYPPELEFMATGKVTNAFNKPLPNVKVSMLSRKPQFITDTTTGKDGRVVFKNLPYADTAIYFIQARNKNGKSFNVNIDVDEVKALTFIKPIAPATMPWYVNSDTTVFNYIKGDVLLKQQEYLPAGGHLLKEVKITAKKVIKGSQNLNGPGNADQVIDEKELEKAGKKTFLQLLEEKIKGFREGFYKSPYSFPSGIKEFENRIRYAIESEWYFVYEKPMILLIDGIEVRDFIPPPFGFIDLKNYLQGHTAEDIKGIEVNVSSKYNLNYLKRWRDAPIDILSYRDFAFIEITTRSGYGPGIDNTPGTFLYKPLAFSFPKQFYKPKYTVNDTAHHTLDLRSTIDWEPNIVTDKNGNATVSFYAADKPSTYTLIVEGSDMNGSLGYSSRKIKISKPKAEVNH
jgi:hypothetical protein